jgi:hypothetical protein
MLWCALSLCEQGAAVIVLDLKCEENHRFEGWFASPEIFEQQLTRHMVHCPVCGDGKISRLPSAPNIVRRSNESSPAAKPPAQLLNQLAAALLKAASDAEDVGEHFADEARKIHYGDAEGRNIRGTTSAQEALGLLEEGISVLPLPAGKEDLH